MADMTSVLYSKPKMLVPDGRGVSIPDKAFVTSLTANDTISFAMPAGLEVVSIYLFSDDVESTTTSAFRMGYLKKKSSDTLTPDDDYFAAAGQTLLRAGGGSIFLFPPIKFEVEWILQILLNTGGTITAGGALYATVNGNMKGVEGSSLTGLGNVFV